MPFLDDPSASTSPAPLRLICMGESGMGKTGSLLSLAEAGYTLHIADLECKAASLFNSLFADGRESRRWTAEQISSMRSRIEIEEIAEPVTEKDGALRLASASSSPAGKAYARFGEIVGSWATTYTSPHDIIVIDSLSKLSDYAANVTLAANKRPILQVQDYTAIYNAVSNVLSLLTAWDSKLAGLGKQIDAHVIVLAHIQYYAVKRKVDGAKLTEGKIGSGDSEVVDTKLYPLTIGDKFSAKVPTWFNGLVKYDTAKNKPGERIIRLVADDDAPIKLPAPAFAAAKKSLPIETGLADIFRVCGGTGGAAA